MTDAKAGDVAKGAALIARLSGLKPAVVDLIDSADFEALCGLAGSAPTGGAVTARGARSICRAGPAAQDAAMADESCCTRY